MEGALLKDYRSLDDFFDSISECNYSVLRNYEDFADMDFLNSHPDLDLLCDNVTKLVASSGLVPKKKNDNTHFCVMIAGVKVPVDLREIGDGYYCSAWEKAMLASRVKNERFYVLDDKNYFYSLLYHAFIQKDVIAPEYKVRLKGLADKIGIDFSIDNGIELLDSFIRDNGYVYSFPKNVSTKANFGSVDPSLIENNKSASVKKKMYNLYKKLKKRSK